MHARSIRSPLFAIAAVLALSHCSSSSDGTNGSASTLPAAPLSTMSQSSGLLRQIPRAPTFNVSTVPVSGPGAGDLNPYGVAIIPNPSGFPGTGFLNPGDVIVANFNNAQNPQGTGNLQGTGTTIVRVNPNGNPPAVFFQDSANPGFSTALGVLSAGFVLIGNVPSTPTSPGTMLGTCNDLQQDVGNGDLRILDTSGNVVESIGGLFPSAVAGPWDLTVVDDVTSAIVFVSMVKSGLVFRFNLNGITAGAPPIVSLTQIASGYKHDCNGAAFVVGPTGLAFDRVSRKLYVASTEDNAIFAISNADSTMMDNGEGALVASDPTHFHGPLGLVRSSNGNLISAQGDAINPVKSRPSEIVEVTATGSFVSEFSIDHAAGSAFGLALLENAFGSRFAAVNDGTNTLEVWDF